jgi:tetrahydromethanopterin S-methyltransferase subunit F
MLKRQKKTTEVGGNGQGGAPVKAGKVPKSPAAPKVYGMIAEFANEEELVHAAERAYASGFRKMDAFTPFPSEEVLDAMHLHNNRVPLVVLICGLSGLALGFLLQYYVMVVDYPLNFNGRAPFAWPAFVPAMFETTILGAAFGAVFGMLIMNGLPMLYHPVFNTPNFKQVSKDGYFFCIEADDPAYEPAKVRQFFVDNRARNVTEVNW